MHSIITRGELIRALTGVIEDAKSRATEDAKAARKADPTMGLKECHQHGYGMPIDKETMERLSGVIMFINLPD